MTGKQITEFNKLIQRWSGDFSYSIKNKEGYYIAMVEKRLSWATREGAQGYIKYKNLQAKGYSVVSVPENIEYNKSWGDLMRVVEKIEKGNYGFKMCRKVVEVYFDDTKEVILKTKEDCRLNSLYKAVVEFIKWEKSKNAAPR